MSYIESKLALENGLLEYYQGLILDSTLNNVATTEESEELAEKIGLIVHFPIASIVNEIKKVSAYRAKYIPNGNGEPNMELALGTDEDELIYKYLKTWANKVFDEVSNASINVPNGYLYEDTKTAVAYTNQTSFLAGDLYTNGGKTFRCLTDTEEIPSVDSTDWIEIEGGDVKRIYFTLLLNEYWDTNAAPLLESSVFNAMVAAVLKEWYKITNRPKEQQEYSVEYEENITDAKSATYRRVRGIVIKQQPI